MREQVIIAREPERGVRTERLTTPPATPHHHRATAATVETLLSAHEAPVVESGVDTSPAQMPAATSRADLHSRMREQAHVAFEDSRTNARMTLSVRRKEHPPTSTSVTRPGLRLVGKPTHGLSSVRPQIRQRIRGKSSPRAIPPCMKPRQFLNGHIRVLEKPNPGI